MRVLLVKFQEVAGEGAEGDAGLIGVPLLL